MIRLDARPPSTLQHSTPHRRLIITIDGPAGVGKSTAAHRLARHLGVRYLDTGATYRALAYAARQAGLDPAHDVRRLATLARALPLEWRPQRSGGLRVVLAGVDVTAAIRTEQVSEDAAQLSRHPAVRRIMVRYQRRCRNDRGVVAEGRDTGSVVFPDATYKFFLDADPEVRARRRQQELFQLSGARPPLERIRRQLHRRDAIDRNRRVGPLVKPAGARVVDTSHLSARQVVRALLHGLKHHALSKRPRGLPLPAAARQQTGVPSGTGQAGAPTRGLACRAQAGMSPPSRRHRGGHAHRPLASRGGQGLCPWGSTERTHHGRGP